MAPILKISEIKLRLQTIIKNTKTLERINTGDTSTTKAGINNIKQQLEQDFKQLEELPQQYLSAALKKRQVKRQKAKQRAKLKHKIAKNLRNHLNTTTNYEIALATTSKAPILIKQEATALATTTISTSTARHHQLHNYRNAQSFLRSFELLKILHYARGHDIEATREFALKFNRLNTIWYDILHDNIPQRTDQSKLEDQWNSVFFGATEMSFYGAAPALNLNDFFRIRNTWDSYLTNDQSVGSSIPTGWVLPKPDADDRWLAYRKN